MDLNFIKKANQITIEKFEKDNIIRIYVNKKLDDIMIISFADLKQSKREEIRKFYLKQLKNMVTGNKNEEII